MMIKDRIIPAVNKVCNQINELQKKTCVVNPYENQFKEQYKIIEKLKVMKGKVVMYWQNSKLNITYK